MLGPDDGELRPSNFLHLAHQLSAYIWLHPKPQAFRHAKLGELVGGGTPWG